MGRTVTGGSGAGVGEGHPHVSQKMRDMGRPVCGWSVQRSRRKLTRKQRGEMAEAAALGLRVAKPWGESSRYDLIVDTGKKLLRVQVKSAHRAGEYGGSTFMRTEIVHGCTGRMRSMCWRRMWCQWERGICFRWRSSGNIKR
jgi:hypothetical protein